MRFEHEGRSLWFGTADAPAPDVVQAGEEAVITIGVWPVDPSNRVELLYRVNQGTVKNVGATWFRNDPTGKAQYFRVRLQGFHAGDVVEYVPICSCAGRQVPGPEDSKQFAASFTVSETSITSTGPVGIVERSLLAQKGTLEVASSALPKAQPTVPPARSVLPSPRPNGSFATATPGTIGPIKPAPLPADLLRAKTLEYAGLAGLDQQSTNKLLEKNLTFDRLNPATLSGLVRDGVLTENQRTELEFTLELGALTGDNVALVRSLKNKGVKSTVELISWQKEHWQQLITTDKIDLPAGETAESYTEKLLLNLDRTFPSQLLLNGLLTNWQAKLALIDFPANSPQQTELTAFATKYRHLGILDLLKDQKTDASQKKNAIAGRLHLLDAFYQNNQNLDLRQVNFFKSTDAIINWGSVPVNERTMVRKQLMAYQRVLNLAESTDDRQALLGNGYDSAMMIAGKTESEFMNTSGLSSDKAGGIYIMSQENALRVCLDCAAIREVAGVSRLSIPVNNVPDSLINDLRDIDGFADLFGSQGYCDCEGCRSILGPAAYFVDLMSFIERHVSKAVFVDAVPDRSSSSLYLRNRRPDLWNLRLTCENTFVEVPYLTIVNEVLEEYLRTAFSGDVFEKLSRRTEPQISFGLPFNLPLAELRLYLSHFGLTLHDIYRTLHLAEDKVWRERLELSDEDLFVVETDKHNVVKRRFGDPTPLADFYVDDYKNDTINVDERGFINYAGITRDQLDELLAMRCNPDLRNIVVQPQPLPDELQNFPEILKNVTEERLDFIHRFIRLWRKTKWSIPALDLVWFTMRQAGLTGPDSNEITRETVLYLARLTDVQQKLRLSVEEACSLIDELPVPPTPARPRFFASLPVSRDFPSRPEKRADQLLFERLFDVKKLFGPLVLSAEPEFPFHHFSLDRRPTPDLTSDPKTPVLLGGLGISETELLLLLDLLKAEMPFDNEGKTRLNRQKISLLYRHARLAKALKLSIEDFIQSLRLNFAANDLVVTRLDQIQHLIKFRDWLKLSPFTVSELRFILKSEESTAVKFKASLETAGALVFEIQKSQPAPGTTELKSALTKSLNVTDGQFNDMLNWIGSDINSTAIVQALNTTFQDNDPTQPNTPAELDALVTLIKELERVKLLLTNLKFKEENINYLTSNPSALNITDLRTLSLADVKAFTFYKQMTTLHEEGTAMVHAILDKLETRPFTDVQQLADLWKQDLSLITSLVNSLPLPATPIHAIERLWEALAICQILGINGYSLQKLADDSDFGKFVAARDVALGAFSSKYEDEKVLTEKLEPFQDQINVIRRDALCDYIIAQEDELKFKDRSDIYSFFMLDVEMSGCARISRVVAATSSLQAYVHRVLTNLERSASDPNLIVLKLTSEREVFKREWEWRKNYRVWEANRKVFLYPENYIEPDLRDNKSPTFTELEDALLQEKITEGSATDAYRKYVAGLTALSRLRIVGSYYHAEDNTYYLFGRTHTQPYQYYYRTYQQKGDPPKHVWGNWTKMELTIEAREISALIYLRRLYIFWTQVERREISKIVQGASDPAGYIFNVYSKYSYLDEQGKWQAAQKVSIGYFIFDEAIIQRRIWNGEVEPADPQADPSEPKNPSDAQRTILLEQFQEEIFRKPYPILSDQPQAPIKLYYIWSHDKSDTATDLVETYRTRPFDQRVQYTRVRWEGSQRHGGECVESPHEDRIRVQGGFEFVVTNSNFGGRQRIGYQIRNSAYAGDLIIENARECKLAIDTGSSDGCEELAEQITIQVDLVEAFGGPHAFSKVSVHDLSLANNIIVDAATRSFPDAGHIQPKLKLFSDAQVAFLQAEEEKAYSKDVQAGYVQDGTTGFTSSGRFLTQYAWITSELAIPDQSPITLSATLVDELSGRIFAKELDDFLSLATQTMPDGAGYLNFDGPYGAYYKELFFHIPFLIANHLNANQKFKEAKWWYERIFDPASGEAPEPARQKDRNWQYRQFRQEQVEKLRDVLTNEDAIHLYKNDPFNPHAIARLRLTAYQKAIVMKYIDNLIDWGDQLFAQDSIESINEATMLYVLAADILGKRPVKLGKCETASDGQLTFERVVECTDGSCSEFLVYLENWHFNTVMIRFGHRSRALASTSSSSSRNSNPFSSGSSNPFLAAGRSKDESGFAISRGPGSSVMNVSDSGNGTLRFTTITNMGTIRPNSRFPNFDVTTQSTLAFCVPQNHELLKYWDRVEDRLFKIRHCMNISGVRRKLALFQPPIDPAVLVRARAAGLSLEDVLAALDAPPPHYRFNYLISTAKQFIQTVQSFGTTLLGALEKKDVEELTLLRSLHERDIQRLTKQIKKQQLLEAQHQYQAMVETRTNVQNRITYFHELLGADLTVWEEVQQKATRAATLFETTASTQKLIGAMLSLLPQLGSAFAMKYGGVELGNNAQRIGMMLSSLASISQSVASAASIEANFQRRKEEWRHQHKLALQELKQLDQQVMAADVRQLIAAKDLETHEKGMEQADELHEFYKNKFTNLGLYDYLSTSLTRLYREAYIMAYDMAKIAESAYKFERGDETALFIAEDNWQFGRAGLLAGERLMLQLQRLEKAYLEQHTRDYEVNQSFSLALMNPSALVSLRETGSCEFTIPEIWFDLFYPGQYRRVIKSVRLSIPCVAGPYTNVSGKLSLKNYKLRRTAATGPLDVISPNSLTSIATSSGQNDGGLFELNFRDERYLPFEGAGAVDSTWGLELPSAIRLFDYDTISDVIIHINYTARDGGSFKDTIENEIVDTLTQFASTNGLSRLLSLKHEFPNAFHRLLHPAGAEQETTVALNERHFPYFLTNLLADPVTNKRLAISDDVVTVYLKTKGEEPVNTTNMALRINNSDVGNWINLDRNLHAGTVSVSGSPIRQWPISAGNGLQREVIDDVLILLKYKLEASE